MTTAPASPGPPDDDGYPTRPDAEAQGQSEAAYDADPATVEEGVPPDDVSGRAALLPEEREPGSADPETQARVILEDSLLRTEVPGAAPSTHLEHRRSEDTV